jgi:oxygen-independent coproporphyrinogen-3 oxidase
MEEYFAALKREIEDAAVKCRDHVVSTAFFGGGTPSFPGEELICGTLLQIKSCFEMAEDAEISIEVNPASAISDKLIAYRKAGFNRISIGAQSLSDRELGILGRLHDSSMFFETYENARRAGFDNINVDLMSALPGQRVEDYIQSLEGVILIGPEHISAYSLIVEEGTPFYDMELELPSEEDDRLMYHETKRILSDHGYHRYEISNYARGHEYECRHNKVYWKRGNYLGLGLGAASMVDNVRWSNTRDINEYIQNAGFSNTDGDNCSREMDGLRNEAIRKDIQILSTKEQMEEFMFLGLRLVEGVSMEAFAKLFGRDIHEVYGDVIRKYEATGHLITEGNMLRLSDTGLDVSNTIMAEFIFD